MNGQEVIGVDSTTPAQDGRPYVLSPDGARFAITCSRDDSWFVLTERGPGPMYPALTRSVPPVFSSTGRLAYGVQTHAGFRLVVDDVMISGGDLVALPALFSPDGRRLFWVERSLAGAQQWVVIDGEAMGRHAGISADPLGRPFSPDSRRFAFYALASEGGAFVVDGQRTGP